MITQHSNHQESRTATTTNTPGWHQRVMRKVLFRGTQQGDLPHQLLNMQAAALTMDEAAAASGEEFLHVSPSSFHHPPMLRRPSSAPALLEILSDPSSLKLDDTSSATVVSSTTQGQQQQQQRVGGGGGPFSRVTGAALSIELSKRLDRWSRGRNENLRVKCEPTGGVRQLLLRGEARFNATINLDRIVFGNIRFSGGQLEAQNFAINLLSESQRFPNQFDLLGHDLTMTQEDLFESSCIRNGLRRLLTRIFKNRGLTVIAHQLTSITILPTGKISIMGHVAPLVGPVIPFEVRTGIDAAQGSILSFPGLEISVHPSLGLFVPVPTDVTVDMGQNAQLMDVAIDGQAGKLTISARVTITPGAAQHPQSKQQKKKKPSLALCSVDVGRWLTRLGRFAE